MPSRRPLLLAILVLALTAPAAAQDRAPSAEDIVRQLRPAESGMRLMMRGVKIEPAAAQPESPPSIDLSINFEFGSARLTSDALIVLDNLGRALNDPDLKRYRFVIAGHTDGVGGDAVNLRLSEARARSVTQYLAEKHGVAAERLVAKGFGFRHLLYPSDPTNSLNRRVQITTLIPDS